MVIADFEDDKGAVFVIVKNNSGTYDVLKDGVIVQPNHDLTGIIRYLSHQLHNTYYRLQVSNKKS